MKNTKVIIVLIIAFLIVSCSKDDDQIYTNDIRESKVNYTEDELEIIYLVNEYRESIGLNKLKVLDIVSSVALTHSKYMAETGIVSHINFPDRNEKLVKNANAKSVAENVAYGFTTAQGAVDGWLNSEEHRKTIKNSKFSHFGISIEKNNENRKYFTQLFISK